MTLADHLSRQAVRRLAGSSSLERGEDYASAGAVRITDQGPERVAARVQGTRRYDVVLTEEEALELLGPASDMVDHSHGGLAPLAERLGTLHLEACRSGAVDPVALGQRLVELEPDSRHEVFYGAVDDYAEVLGEAGLAAYREAAERRWSRVRALGPGESDRDGSADRFRITRIMERLADLTDGVDDVVAVLSRDLSSGYKFLRIAEVLRDAGRFGDALAWAERGLAAFPGRADRKLREYAAEEHHRSGRHDQAMKLV